MRVDGRHVKKHEQATTFTPSFSWAVPTFHRDVHPVARQANRAEQTTNTRNRSKTSAKLTATYQTGAKLFHYVVAGRLPCRRYVPNPLFVSLPNRDDSRVDRNPASEPKRWPVETCSLSHETRPLRCFSACCSTQRQRVLMVVAKLY
jgi:hypothetical protein